MHRILAGLALAFAAGTAHAEIVTVRYDFPDEAHYAFDYFQFGAELAPVSGEILSTTLFINYTTSGDLDAADFYYSFLVPVEGAQESFIGLTGTDLGWSGQGTFHYSFEDSELYNGTIRPGRFGAEYAGGGSFTDSYLEFIVDADLPDPISADGFDPPIQRCPGSPAQAACP
jgi:hypothetical protein